MPPGYKAGQQRYKREGLNSNTLEIIHRIIFVLHSREPITKLLLTWAEFGIPPRPSLQRPPKDQAQRWSHCVYVIKRLMVIEQCYGSTHLRDLIPVSLTPPWLYQLHSIKHRTQIDGTARLTSFGLLLFMTATCEGLRTSFAAFLILLPLTMDSFN